jgi:TonB family protein
MARSDLCAFSAAPALPPLPGPSDVRGEQRGGGVPRSPVSAHRRYVAGKRLVRHFRLAMTGRRLFRAAMVAAPVLVSACASSGAANSTFPVCQASRPSTSLSLLEAVADSAGFAAALRALWEPGTGLTLAQVFYGLNGAFFSANVASRELSDATKEEISTTLQAMARPRGAAGEMVHLVLGDSAGPSPRRVAALRTCRPVLSNERDLQRLIGREARRLDEQGLLPDAAMPVLWLYVGADGLVRRTQVNQGSGAVAVDQAAARIMSNATFSPALLEDIPVAVWVQIPVRLQVIGPRPEPDPDGPNWPPPP